MVDMASGYQFSRTEWLATLFILGFALRLAVILFVSDCQTVRFEYMLIAKNLLEGRGFSWDDWGSMALQPTSIFPPLYVYWCALFLWLSPGDYLPLYVAQGIVAASGIIPAYRVGTTMFSPRAGMIFGVLYSVYPEMVFLPCRPVPEFLCVVLCLWIVYLYLVLTRKGSDSGAAFWPATLAGLTGGVALLVKGAAVVFIVAPMLALLIQKPPIFRVLRSYLLPMVAAAIVVVAPWTVRNWLVQGRVIPIRTGYGLNLWIGNHDGATGTPYTLDGRPIRYSLPREYDAYIQQALPDDEQDRDDFYVAEALRFIRANPVEYLTLCAKRLWYFVWFVPGHALAKDPIYRVTYVLLLLIAVPGILMAVRHKRLDPVIVILCAGYLALYVPVMILPRYRIVPVVFLLLLASYALSLLWERKIGKRMATAVRHDDTMG